MLLPLSILGCHLTLNMSQNILQVGLVEVSLTSMLVTMSTYFTKTHVITLPSRHHMELIDL